MANHPKSGAIVDKTQPLAVGLNPNLHSLRVLRDEKGAEVIAVVVARYSPCGVLEYVNVETIECTVRVCRNDNPL